MAIDPGARSVGVAGYADRARPADCSGRRRTRGNRRGTRGSRMGRQHRRILLAGTWSHARAAQHRHYPHRDAGIRNQVKDQMAKSNKKTTVGRRGFLKTTAAFVAAAPVAATNAAGVQAPAAGQDWLSLTREAALEPDLPIIDPHHHFWNDADRSPR